jgi:uncharacterized protein (DUF924 family)
MRPAQSVLDFWFGKPLGPRRKAWFEKNGLFDESIRARFLTLHNAAAGGACAAWSETAQGALALIVLTDQFPRNLFRGSGRAFATDAIAIATARHVLDKGWDTSMLPVERMFVYLPFEHSEVLADQDRSCTLFEPLDGFPETADAVEYSEKHRVIVRRFGRFPHRNAALGRKSTPEETEFLKQPGSGF